MFSVLPVTAISRTRDACREDSSTAARSRLGTQHGGGVFALSAMCVFRRVVNLRSTFHGGDRLRDGDLTPLREDARGNLKPHLVERSVALGASLLSQRNMQTENRPEDP